MAYDMRCENCFYNNAAHGLAVPVSWCFLLHQRTEPDGSCVQFKGIEQGFGELDDFGEPEL